MTRRAMLSALAVLPVRARLRAQEQKPGFSADVKVVNLFASVRDKKDQIVRDLSKDDFLLEEDGRPQVIRYFALESDLPLTLGLLVDTSGSTSRVLPDERDAAGSFLQQVMRPEKDNAFVIHFDSEVELLQDVTNSRELLEKALGELQAPQLMRRRAGGGDPGGGRGRGPGRHGWAGTLLYDAVFLGSDEIMRKQRGRKALVLLSDGMDRGSKETLSAATEAAQRADTLVYTILFSDPEGGFGSFGGPRMGRRGGMGRGPGMNRPDGRKVMEQAARETGGRFFEVSRRLPMEKIFANIEEDLRSQYSIGYTSDQPTGGGYRHIQLTTKRKGLSVQTRAGYYAS